MKKCGLRDGLRNPGMHCRRNSSYRAGGGQVQENRTGFLHLEGRREVVERRIERRDKIHWRIFLQCNLDASRMLYWAIYLAFACMLKV
jgi:hypothetical protein